MESVFSTVCNPDDSSIIESSLGDIRSSALKVGAVPYLGACRALIRFDLTHFQHIKVKSVILTLQAVESSSSSAIIINAYRLTSSWTASKFSDYPGLDGFAAESTDPTWLHRENQMKWQRPGADYVQEPSSSSLIGDIGTYTLDSTARMISDVQYWIDCPAYNFGWILISDSECEANSIKMFANRDFEFSYRPTLCVQWT